MTKHKVAELEGALLDAAVAKAEGWNRDGQGWQVPVRIAIGPDESLPGLAWQLRTDPWSSEWMYGGPIIERERIELQLHAASDGWWAGIGSRSVPGGGWIRTGPAPLIAAMRAYVASKLGDEVEL